MKIVNGYATYEIYEVLKANVGGQEWDVLGAKLEEVVGQDAANARLAELAGSGRRATAKYLCGIEDPSAISRRAH